mgnify:CR=1 FL=1
MKKHFIIPQPPLVEKFTFLVDNISDNRNWGKTTDIDKIEYNRRLLGEDMNIELDVNLQFTDTGMTTVLPLGRFITVLQISKDESKGSMTFFDFQTNATRDELKEMIGKVYSENLTNQWFKFYDMLLSEFKNEDDCVQLLKPESLT